MPFPNVPEKYDADPVVTPGRQADYRDERTDDDAAAAPDAVVLCYSRGLMEYVADEYVHETVDRYYGDCYVLNDTGDRVGVLGNFGIGAPTAAMLVEELVADGVEAVLSVGFAGVLDADIGMGEFVVPDRAIRDEGTSHHYRPSEKHAHPTADLRDATTDLLAARDEPHHVGGTWTTDAIYRETEREVEQYASEGVLTVEMEAATVFTVAAHRGVDAGGMFVASDYLGPDDWEPKFHLAGDDIRQLGDTAVDVLDGYVD
jgi:uridine phosphorylase